MKTIGKSVVTIFCVSALLSCTHLAYGFKEATHERINAKAVADSNIGHVLKDSYGFDKGYDQPLNEANSRETVLSWISLGGRLEDQNYDDRSIHHFHDPLKSWSQAGFSGVLFGTAYSGMSSAIWMQNNSGDRTNYWSWQAARQHQYDALTAADENARNENFAKCFRSVGQVMHLVEDSSVPAHVRDDFHPNFIYEHWLDAVRVHDAAIFENYLSSPVYPQLPSAVIPVNSEAPIPISQLIDTDRYTGGNPDITATLPTGLAEYTNANFLSEDTRFDKYSYPSFGSVTTINVPISDPYDETRTVERPYYVKVHDGDNSGYRLATVGYLRDYITKYFPDNSNEMIKGYIDALPPALDGGCYNDYAERLVPRALGYATTLLNYFFRGDVEAVEASATQDTNGVITGMKMKVKNATANEGMAGGDLVVSCRYLPANATEYTYTKSAEVAISPLASGATSDTEYTFEFPDPIPSGATDIQYTLVYRGQLGAETDAVAAKADDFKAYKA